MSPHPNNNHDGQKSILKDEQQIDNNRTTNLIMVTNNDDIDNESSDDNDTAAETEYDGYKLLSQDESQTESVHLSDENGICETFCMHLVSDDIPESKDINYQHLTCNGFDSDISAELGFPDIQPEYEEIDPENIRNRDDNIEMNDDKVELVKNAMVGFSLPLSNIPEWAKNLSEEKWKESLIKSVYQKK